MSVLTGPRSRSLRRQDSKTMAQQPERYPGMDRCLVEEVLRRMEARDGQREASTSLVVAVRARPLNSRERAACAKPCVIMHGKQVVIADPVAAAAAVVAAAGNGAEASEAVEAVIMLREKAPLARDPTTIAQAPHATSSDRAMPQGR